MDARCLVRHEELVADLAVGSPGGHQGQHLGFSGREPEARCRALIESDTGRGLDAEALPSLSRLGVARAYNQGAYSELPEPARDEQRAFWSTPRHNRSVRDEFSEIRTAMTQAQSLTSLGDRPLVVITAEQEAPGGWMAAQDQLAALSTNSDHRVLPAATHSSLTENENNAAQSSRAILAVVDAVRTGAPVVE